MIEIRPDVVLPAHTRVALVSDVHLGDGSAGDLFGRKDELFLRVLERELASADVLVINGDAVDHVQAYADRRIERAHPRVFQELRALSERRRVLYVLGNHEHPVPLKKAFPNFEYATGIAVGTDLLITHGHQFDIHWGEGRKSHGLARFHSFLETALRRPIRQPLRDYVNLPNRVVHRAFYQYIQSMKLYAAMWRAFGKPEKYERSLRVDNFWARGQWGDLGCIFQNAETWLHESHAWNTLILGHSHQPGVVTTGDKTYANLGSWALESATYARIGAGKVRVFDAHTDRELGDERYQMLISGADLPDMKAWFRRYYRGFFRYDMEAIHRDYPHHGAPPQLQSHTSALPHQKTPAVQQRVPPTDSGPRAGATGWIRGLANKRSARLTARRTPVRRNAR